MSVVSFRHLSSTVSELCGEWYQFYAKGLEAVLLLCRDWYTFYLLAWLACGSISVMHRLALRTRNRFRGSDVEEGVLACPLLHMHP